MLVFTKIMAFILLLIWGALTMVITFSIIGALIFGVGNLFDDWFCGGKQLLAKVLQ